MVMPGPMLVNEKQEVGTMKIRLSLCLWRLSESRKIKNAVARFGILRKGSFNYAIP